MVSESQINDSVKVVTTIIHMQKAKKKTFGAVKWTSCLSFNQAQMYAYEALAQELLENLRRNISFSFIVDCESWTKDCTEFVIKKFPSQKC